MWVCEVCEGVYVFVCLFVFCLFLRFLVWVVSGRGVWGVSCLCGVSDASALNSRLTKLFL